MIDTAEPFVVRYNDRTRLKTRLDRRWYGSYVVTFSGAHIFAVHTFHMINIISRPANSFVCVIHGPRVAAVATGRGIRQLASVAAGSTVETHGQ